MPWFEGTHERTVTVAHPLDVVRAHFSNLANIAKHTEHLESHAIEGDVIHLVLKEQNNAGIKYKGDYKCRFVLDGNTLTWTPEGENNTVQAGSATFAEVDGGTAVTYNESVKVDLGVPAMMAPMLQPVIGPMIGKEIGEFFDRVVGAIG